MSIYSDPAESIILIPDWYLCTLDFRWDFGYHFRGLVPKLVAALREGARWLLQETLSGSCPRSITFYGAPVWAEAPRARTIAILRRPQWVLSIRVIRKLVASEEIARYPTISFDATSLLAGSPPVESAPVHRLLLPDIACGISRFESDIAINAHTRKG